MPLACHLYDQLEIAIMQKKPIRLHLQQEGQPDRLLEGRMVDLTTQAGKEYLKTDKGEVIDTAFITHIEPLD
jgi:transcriptional antiterminator Rof (Rho-off)